MNTALLTISLAVLHCLLPFSLCIPAINSAEDVHEEATDMNSNEEDSIVQKREASKLSAKENLDDETQLSKLPSEINPCNLVPEKGNCKENITRFYYDDLQKNCLPLENTGCGSNDNNFGSLGECENICIKKRESRKVVKMNKYKAFKDLDISRNGNSENSYGKRKFPVMFCNLQRDNGVICPGIKRGNYLNQYFFDDGKNRCIPFVYNGCGGNANRFSSIWECTSACEKKSVTNKSTA